MRVLRPIKLCGVFGVVLLASACGDSGSSSTPGSGGSGGSSGSAASGGNAGNTASGGSSGVGGNGATGGSGGAGATGGSGGASATGGSAGGGGSSGSGGSAGQATGGSAGQATGGTAGQATGGAAGQGTGGTSGQGAGGAAGSAGATDGGTDASAGGTGGTGGTSGAGGAAGASGGAAGGAAGDSGSDAAVLAAPTDVKVMPGDMRVTVMWSAVPGADSYNLYFASQQGVTKSNYAGLPDGAMRTSVTSAHTEFVLDPEKTYRFRVTSLKGGAESGESLELGAVPALAAKSVAIEGSASSLVATTNGQLIRVSNSTLQPTALLAEGISQQTNAIAIENGGVSVLLAERGTGTVGRVDLATGAHTAIATGYVNLASLALAPGGAFALVAADRLYRVTLPSGPSAQVGSVVTDPIAVAVEASGTTALVTNGYQLERVTLSSGASTVLATTASLNLSMVGGSMIIEPGGKTLLTTDNGCVGRVDLWGVPFGKRIACQLQATTALALDSNGTVLVGGSQRLERVHLSLNNALVTAGLGTARDVAIEPGGTTALLAEEGGFVTTPRVLRVNLSNGSYTQLASPSFFSINGIAIAPGRNAAYTIGDGVNLIGVDLTSGAITPLTNLLSYAYTVAVQPGEASALVHGVNLYQVDLGTSAVSNLAGSMPSGGLVVEPGGATALYTSRAGLDITRIDLATGQRRPLVRALWSSGGGVAACSSITLEAGGTALLSQPGRDPTPDQGRVIRVDLSGPTVTAVAAMGFHGPGVNTCGMGGLAVEPGGMTVLVADSGGGLRRLTLP